MKLTVLTALALYSASSLAAINLGAAYPAGSIAARAAELLNKNWGKEAFGGQVGQQEWPSGSSPMENNIEDKEEEEDKTTTVYKTVVVTTTKTRSHTAEVTPAPRVKRSLREALSGDEEAAFLNDIFSLGLFKEGARCDSAFQTEVCAKNRVLVCSESHNVWEKAEDCSKQGLKCGATGAQDGSNGVNVMCLSDNLIDYPETRPSDKIRIQIQAIINK